MKKLTVLLLTAVLLLLPMSAVHGQSAVPDVATIPLKLTDPSIHLGQAYALPNGSYLVEYDTPYMAEFWLNMGRDDVYHHVLEIFDASGASVWRVSDNCDYLPEDADGYLFQFLIYPDRFTYEYYWNHLMERYYLDTWGFDGTVIENPKDAIWQAEEDARYVESQYPYLLEMWPFGEDYAHPAKLTYVMDGASVDLPFVYGSRTTAVSNERYFMLYRDHESVRLLIYDPTTRTLQDNPTSLPTESGYLAVANDTAYFLTTDDQVDGYLCELFSASLPTSESSIEFQSMAQFPLETGHVVDALIESNGTLYAVITGNQTSLYALAGNHLTEVFAWPDEARYLGTAADSLRFITPNESGDGYDITMLTPNTFSTPLVEAYASNGSQRISFMYPEHYKIEVDDYLGTVVFFNSMDQISVTLPRHFASAIDQLHDNIKDTGEFFVLADDLELNALHGGNQTFPTTLDNVEIALNLPNGTGVILNVSSLYGDTEVYDLLLTIFSSIADEAHTALLEAWLSDIWIPFLHQ